MTPELIAQIRAALEGSAEWYFEESNNTVIIRIEPLYYKQIYYPPEMQSTIQAACLLTQHTPALLDEIEDLRARVAELEAEKKTCRRPRCPEKETDDI